MLKNYLKIALRNLRRHKAYTFINVFGLAVGLACCLLILFYVQDELSYDTYHEKADRIHRLVRSRSAYTAAPMAPALVAEMPRVSHAARIQKFNDVLILNGDEKRFTETVFAADTSLFDIFSFTFVRGHPKTALSRPDGLILTESAVQKYFGEDDPMGKALILVGVALVARA